MIVSEGRSIEILLVEDDEGDVELTRIAFEEAKLVNCLHVVMDGAEALDFLYRREAFNDAPRPDVILLDLNLPKKNGKEVLEVIKKDDSLKTIPVVILTTSDAEKDIAATYANHANYFITKPVDLEKFVEIVGKVEDFWLHVVKLPRSDAESATK